MAVAKKDLKAGEVLDGLGGFTCYALIDNFETCRKENLLPMGVSQDCVLKRGVAIDAPITYDDVTLPSGRLVDQLRREMNEEFF